MPGLNQLKHFVEDIKEVGNEPKIRAQRGERPVSIPLPEGISEEDDSNDFLIGLPEVNTDDSQASEVDEGTSTDELNSLLDDASSLADTSDIDSLLSPDTADDDALNDFLNDTPGQDNDDAGLESLPEEKADELSLADMDLDSLLTPSSGNIEDLANLEETADQNPGTEEINLNNDIPKDILENDGIPPESADQPLSDDSLSLDDLSSLTGLNDLPSSDSNAEQAKDSDSALADENLDFSSPDALAGNFEDLNTDTSLPDDASLSGADNASAAGESNSSDDIFSMDFDSLADMDSFGQDGGSTESPSPASTDSLEDAIPDSSPEINEGGEEDKGQNEDLDLPSMDDAAFTDNSPDASSSDSDESPSSDDIFSMDMDSLPEMDSSLESPFASSDDESSPAASPADDFPSLDNEGSSSDSGFDFNTDMLDNIGEVPDENSDQNNSQENSDSETTLETFDTSGMEDVDFGSSGESVKDEFPVTGEQTDDDDFILDSSFEIPGFSDTETAEFDKKKKGLDTVDFSDAKEGKPRNSLTDEEYIQFKKNLANYPLNLRIALEDFIARDEFTDEAVFEIIEKVLKKTSARQLATQLEKILDVSINIPRDFERRSFAEYEAYKQSFQYQLKNRIIPAAIVGIILCFVCFGLFKAGQHFIYKPVMASINYKEGYTLLENNEYPQSEEKFKTAVSYKPVKKWFFKYAEGYRQRKQYERAGNMYKNILAYFEHDKQAGLNWAEMELYDRANYEMAEEIVRRQVLDYHINDADGILLLGDVFLEWAEEDESKYELAKQQYLDLMQRYGSTMVNLSRMLRYYIRTDKLREVLTYKNIFYQGKDDKKNMKSLGASDWRELSGYLLEKLYGTLSKNDEYLRSSIEDVLAMLNLAIKSDPADPVGHYNLARYFVFNGYTEQAKTELERSLDLFDQLLVRTKKNVYREINATRVLGELYADAREYLKAQTVYTRGIDLYNEEHEATEFQGDSNTGKLFADMGDLDYFISGDMEDALYNYERSIEIKNDTPSINFRVGAIYYGKKDYDRAMSSFIKVAEKEPFDTHILLALGNVLSLRGDNFAARSYYADLLEVLNKGQAKGGVLSPQSDIDDYETVDFYLKVNNNLGVTLYRLANQTGNSDLNAEAMVRLSDSIRAWDALTRNPSTMIRMEGSNLAAQNSKYITHAYPDFEPAIYTDIPRILTGDKVLE